MAKLCFTFAGREICIPIYVDYRIPRYPWPDPGPLRIDDILTLPVEVVAGRDVRTAPIPWLEQMGMDGRQQAALGQLVRVWEAAQALPEKTRSQIGEVLGAEARNVGLGEGTRLELDVRSMG